jgi:hypothetical protein
MMFLQRLCINECNKLRKYHYRNILNNLKDKLSIRNHYQDSSFQSKLHILNFQVELKSSKSHTRLLNRLEYKYHQIHEFTHLPLILILHQYSFLSIMYHSSSYTNQLDRHHSIQNLNIHHILRYIIDKSTHYLNSILFHKFHRFSHHVGYI